MIVEEFRAENQNLLAKLNNAEESHERERRERVQIEAQLRLRGDKFNEQNSIIPGLRIANGKLAQTALLTEIE